ncbi:MAG: tetratricopeptide repeat protein [Chlamydiales bacterium]|nr:tetratricopeptide repeat protein [Chlamydiales bacterium]
MGIDYYSPQWEHSDLTKLEYQETLTKLSNAGKKPLMVTEQGLEVGSVPMWLLESVKGLFGGENRCNKVRVQYELLKLVRYGDRLHYNDDLAPDVLSRLKVSSRENLDSRITTYFKEHPKELRPSFWSRHVTKSSENKVTPLLNFNLAKQDIEKGDVNSAIDRLRICIKNGSPKDAPLYLAQILLNRGNALYVEEGIAVLKKLPQELQTLPETKQLSSELLKKRAELLFLSNNPELALKAYAEVTHDAEPKPWVRQMLASQIAKNSPNQLQELASFKAKGFTLTVDECKQAFATKRLQELPSLVEVYGQDNALVTLASEYKDAKDFATARMFYEMAVTKNPHLIYDLANCYIELERYDDVFTILDSRPNKTSDEHKQCVQKLKKALIASVDEYTDQSRIQEIIDTFAAHGEPLSSDELAPLLGFMNHFSAYEEMAEAIVKSGNVHELIDTGNKYKDECQYNAAIIFYEKAITALPSKKDEILYELSTCYRQLHNFAQSFKTLEALSDKASPMYQKQVHELTIAQGEYLYSQIASLPERVSEQIRSFVKSVKALSQYPSIVSSLGLLRGINSHENQQFLQLGKNEQNFDAILADGHKALELMNIAYNGSLGHNSPTDMPTELSQQIRKLQTLLAEMVEFHKIAPKDAQDLAARASILYLKAYEQAPNTFDEYLNHLVESFIERGDYERAISTFEGLKEKFPSHPVTITQDAYSKQADILLKKGELKACFELLNRAKALFPNTSQFTKNLSHAHYVVGKLFEEKGKIEQAKIKYNEAIRASDEAESDCYKALADILQKDYETGGATEPLFREIFALRKKAKEAKPKTAENLFQFGRLLYHNEHHITGEDYLPALQEAVTLEPNNVQYLYGLLMTLKRRGQPSDEIFSRFKLNGGSIANDYWEPIS